MPPYDESGNEGPAGIGMYADKQTAHNVAWENKMAGTANAEAAWREPMSGSQKLMFAVFVLAALLAGVEKVGEKLGISTFLAFLVCVGGLLGAGVTIRATGRVLGHVSTQARATAPTRGFRMWHPLAGAAIAATDIYFDSVVLKPEPMLFAAIGCFLGVLVVVHWMQRIFDGNSWFPAFLRGTLAGIVVLLPTAACGILFAGVPALWYFVSGGVRLARQRT